MLYLDPKHLLLFEKMCKRRKWPQVDGKVTCNQRNAEKPLTLSDSVDQMFFANAHSLPSNGTGPKPIIIRFVRMFERDLVLDQVYAGALPKGFFILVDLPQ
jgi:hypothetical protein